MTPAPKPTASMRPVVGITLLNLAYFSAYLCYFPTLPEFIEDLGGDKSTIGLLIGISSLTAFGTRPFIGYLVDSVGRKPLLVAGMFAFAFNALLYNLPTDPLAVLPIRLVTGAAFAVFLTAASTYVADAAPEERRGSVLAYYGVATTLAFAIGPAIGGLVVDASALDGAESFFTSRASWLSGAHTEGNFTLLFLGTAAVGVIGGFFAMLLPEPQREREANPTFTFRGVISRPALLPAGVNLTSTFVMAGMVTLLPLFAEDIGLENAGLFFIVYSGGVIGSRLLLSRVIDSVPRATIIIPGIAVLAGSMILLSTATTVPMLFVVAALYGLGAGAFQPALMALTVDTVPAKERGRAMSTFTLGSDLGLSSGSLFLGVIADLAGFRVSFIVAALVALAGLSLFVSRSRTLAPKATETPTSAAVR